MLKKEAIEKLKSYFDIDALIEAIKADEEKDFDIPETLLTADELTQRDEANKSEGKKEGQKIGETIGKEIAAKEMKKAFGVELEGKDLNKLVDAVKTQLSKGDDGLKEQIKLLQQKADEYETKITTIQQEAEAARFDAELLGELPANRADLLSDKEYLTILKSNLQFDAEGVKKNGELLRDTKTANPIDRKSAINQFFSERKWVKEEQATPGGRGGTSTKPTFKPQNMKEAEEEFSRMPQYKDKGTASAEFQQYVTGLFKENPEFAFS